jgi:hypothetical protein
MYVMIVKQLGVKQIIAHVKSIVHLIGFLKMPIINVTHAILNVNNVLMPLLAQDVH